jgi:hypothetical protein
MFKAIGLVITLIAIRITMPTVFHAFEHAMVSFFDLAGHVFTLAPTSITSQMSAMGSINYIPKAAPLPSAFAGY